MLRFGRWGKRRRLPIRLIFGVCLGRRLMACSGLMLLHALHPGRRARNRRGIVPIARIPIICMMTETGVPGRCLTSVAAEIIERIGLTDQPRELGQRITFTRLPAWLMSLTGAVIRRIGCSVLVSIRHRDAASPSGKPPFTHSGSRLLPLTAAACPQRQRIPPIIAFRLAHRHREL